MNSHPLIYHADSRIRFAALRRLGNAVMLHSAAADHGSRRFDILAAAPGALVTYRDGVLRVGDETLATANPIEALGRFMPQAPYHPHFRHGFIGAFGYALSAPHAPTARAANPTRLPDLIGGIYDWSIVTDHENETTTFYTRTGDAAAVWRRLQQTMRPSPEVGFTLTSGFHSELGDAAYGAAFESVMSRLLAGDCYQVNLARHFASRFEGSDHDTAWSIYRRVSAQQPAPFCAYLEFEEGVIASFSPERFLRITHDRVTSTPIKGTRPRSADPEEDLALRVALAASEKDRAENVMIVDLVRHDLGRVCRPGSIRTPSLFAVESFASVHHLVSTVTGERRPEVSSLACLAAAFPAGSITGAPKHAAMAIIDALEPVGRSFYCGAVGYVDDGGLIDTSVAIRTLVIEDGTVHCWGGGGIVADSRVDTERAEIDHKIGGLLQGVAEAASTDLSAA